MQKKKPDPIRLLLRDNKGIFKIVNLTRNKKLFWRKKRIKLDYLFTAQIPGYFIFKDGGLVSYDAQEREKMASKIEGEKGDDKILKNNMEIVPDEGNVQPLKEETIVELKKRGTMDADELVNKISLANKNFDKRTRFSKEKYREKKMRRHSIVFRVERLSVRNVNGNRYAFQGIVSN